MRLVPVLVLLVACGASEPATTEAPPPEAGEAAAHEGAEAGAVAEAAPAAVDGWTHYGEAFALAEVVPAHELLADPAAFAGKTVRVEGRVADVCQKAGCWMVLTEDEKMIRVTMKDHKFAVAKDGAGRTASVEGLLVEKKRDAKDVEHFASEAGDPSLVPEKQAGERSFELVATGVAFRAS